jgi:hypothetical protein
VTTQRRIEKWTLTRAGTWSTRQWVAAERQANERGERSKKCNVRPCFDEIVFKDEELQPGPSLQTTTVTYLHGVDAVATEVQALEARKR